MKKNAFNPLSLSVISLAWAANAWASISYPEDVGLPKNDVKGVLSNFLSWLLAMVGIVALISFVISGILYLTAYGDDDQIKRAKRGMTFSIIGILVALSGFIAVKAIEALLKGSSTI